MNQCKVCAHEQRAEIEEASMQVMQGVRSWKSVARDYGFTHHAGIKNHYDRHFKPPKSPSEQAVDTFLADGELEGMVKALMEQAKMARPEVAPLYALAARNLASIADTKPSQQHLIASLKAIQEITNMGTQQSMMLAYAQVAFGESKGQIEAVTGAKAEIVDAEVIEDGAGASFT